MCLRACLKIPERGRVVLDQPQQAPHFRRVEELGACCGWSSTQPRSFFRHALRHVFVACFALLLLGSGCQKSSITSTTMPLELPALAPDTVLRIHWIGKRQLSLDGSAFYFNRLLDLQESRMLESRTLDHLATVPWRLLHGDAAVANAPVSHLRWILESLKHEEFYLEIRSTNGSMQFGLAVRISEKHAAIWQTNMAFVVDSLTGFSPLSTPGAPHGWSVVHPQAPARIELVRSGQWTVFGIAEGDNILMRELIDHLRKPASTVESPGTNAWVNADVDLKWAARVVGGMTNASARLPKVSIAITGDGGNVFTRSTLTFPEPMLDDLKPWTIPTELIHEPLTSFSAARGTASMVSSLPLWAAMRLGTTPDQLFSWSTGANPFQLYLAARMPDAKARMNSLATLLLNDVNPWLKENGPRVNDAGIPLFERLPGTDGVRWTVPGLWPFVKPAETAGTSFLFAGLTPEQNSGTPQPIRENRYKGILNRTNLVYWGWESTASRLNDLLPVLQTARVLAHKAPLPEKCLPLVWLAAIQPRLRETETHITRTGPDKLELQRKSTLGLSASELHLIADWLESPKFPRGLHTFIVPPPAAGP
jgi:hypothetical protein